MKPSQGLSVVSVVRPILKTEALRLRDRLMQLGTNGAEV